MKSASATGVACMFIINNKYFLSILRAFKLYDLLTRHRAADSSVVVVFAAAAAAVRTCHVSEMIIYLSFKVTEKKMEKRKKLLPHAAQRALLHSHPWRMRNILMRCQYVGVVCRTAKPESCLSRRSLAARPKCLAVFKLPAWLPRCPSAPLHA